MPIFVLNVINEKFICIQKDYMVIYSINEKKNIRKIFYIILGTELVYTLYRLQEQETTNLRTENYSQINK